MMFDWFKKERIIKSPDNVYTVINGELERLHDFMPKVDNNEANLKAVWKRIEKLQEALLKTLDRNPTDQETIKDLQGSVADLYLTGDKDGD